MRRIVYFVMALFLVSMLSTPFLSQSQEISPEQIITGYVPPKVDGYLDFLDSEVRLAEYEDAVSGPVVLTSVTGVEMGIEQYVKYTAGQLFIAAQLPAQSITREALDSISVQIDLNGDQVLSQGDLQIDVIGRYTGLNTGNYELDTFELTTINIFVEESWQPLSGFVGQDETQVIRSTQFQMSQGEAGLQFELGIAYDDLKSSVAEAGFEVAQTNTDLAPMNWDLQIKDIEGQVFSANDMVELNTETNRYASENYNINFYDVNIPQLDTKDLRLDNIEMMQSSQNESETLRLVQDKQSLVRVYVDNPTSSVQPVRVDLQGWKIDTGVITSLGTLTTQFDAPRTVDRDRNVLSDTANFEIPLDWVSGEVIIVKAHITLLSGIDTNSANNDRYEATGLVETQDINIYRVLFNSGTEDAPVVPNQWEADLMDEGFDQSMPLDPNYEYLGTSVVGANNGDGDDINAQLNWAVFGVMLAISNGANLPILDQLHATTDQGGGLADATWAGGAGFSSWGGINSVTGFLTQTHEINHNVMPTPQAKHIGGCTASDSDPDWNNLYGSSDYSIHELGWHSDYGLIDSGKDDFMSYCNDRSTDPLQWISGYRWEHSIDRYSNWVSGSPNPSLSLNQVDLDQAGPAQTAILRGQFQTDAEFPATLEPVFVMPGDNTIFGEKLQLPIFNEEKPYFLEIKYSDGTPTRRASLDEPIFEGEHGQVHDSDSFTFVMPGDNVQSIESITLNSTFDNTQMAQPLQRVGMELGEPDFSVSEFPFGQELAKGTVDFFNFRQPYALEAPGYPPQGVIQYTYDEGQTWLPLGTPISETEPGSEEFVKLIDFDKIPGSVAPGSSFFRIIYSNGLTVSQPYYSPTFTLAPEDPTVEIKDSNDYVETEGVAGEVIFTEETATISTTVGSTVSLSATGSDQGHQALDSSWYQWGVNPTEPEMSVNGLSIDTTVQNGHNEFAYRFTSPGIYNVTVQVVDPFEQFAYDNILINVTVNQYGNAEDYQAFQEALQSQRDFGDTSTTSDDTTTTNEGSQTDTVTDTTVEPTDSAAPSLPFVSIGFITSVIMIVGIVRRRYNT